MKQNYGLSYPFRLSPKGGFAMSSGNDKIKSSMILLLRTRLGERVMETNLGGLQGDYLFSILDDSLVNLIKFEIVELMNKFEPRISLEESDVDVYQITNEDNSVSTFIDISYNVIRDGSTDQLTYAMGGE